MRLEHDTKIDKSKDPQTRVFTFASNYSASSSSTGEILSATIDFS